MDLHALPKQTVMRNPTKGMETRTINSEIRTDPLTGRTARICHFMELKWERPDFEALVAGTDKMCPFCGDRVMQITPCFPEEIVPEGRLTADDMVIFPNIAPYDALGAVATISARHYIPMTAFTPRRIAAAFGLAFEFFQRLEALEHPESQFHLINWNYMPPAGSSLIHPHLQVFATSSAPNLLAQELAASRAYSEERGTNFWDDYVDHEKNAAERYLGRIGRSEWMTAWAPMGVAGDVLAVVDGAVGTLELTPEDCLDIATGLTRLMAAYDRMGVYSFNMNLFPGRKGDDHTRFHLLFSPRTFFNQALATPDVGALRNLYNETLCMAFPEEINTLLKPDFDI